MNWLGLLVIALTLVALGFGLGIVYGVTTYKKQMGIKDGD